MYNIYIYIYIMDGSVQSVYTHAFGYMLNAK